MATSKDIFSGWAFAPRVFAPGAFRGLGTVIVLRTPAAIDYQCFNTRPMYHADNMRPHYRASNTRPHYASEAQDKWS